MERRALPTPSTNGSTGRACGGERALHCHGINSEPLGASKQNQQSCNFRQLGCAERGPKSGKPCLLVTNRQVVPGSLLPCLFPIDPAPSISAIPAPTSASVRCEQNNW
jgi:hypothetical protein